MDPDISSGRFMMVVREISEPKGDRNKRIRRRRGNERVVHVSLFEFDVSFCSCAKQRLFLCGRLPENKSQRESVLPSSLLVPEPARTISSVFRGAGCLFFFFFLQLIPRSAFTQYKVQGGGYSEDSGSDPKASQTSGGNQWSSVCRSLHSELNGMGITANTAGFEADRCSNFFFRKLQHKSVKRSANQRSSSISVHLHGCH